MAHEEAGISNYNDFHKGHFEDAAGRLYRMIAKEDAGANELPWAGLTGGARVVADVRVRKRTLKTKSAIAKGRFGELAQASLVFPRVGDTLRLKLVPALRATSLAPDVDVDDDDILRAHVTLGRQKAVNSPVARLVLKIV